MKRSLSFVEQFNRSDATSNMATIELLNSLSIQQQKSLLDMINLSYKKDFEEMRKRGKIK